MLALAANAHAASLTVSGWTLGEYVDIANGADTGSVPTAELNVTIGGVSGYAYCVDLAQSIGVGTTTGWRAMSADANDQIIRAAWLVDTFHPTFDSAPLLRKTEIAALQVSLWEVMGESSGPYDLFSGAFALTPGGASSGVINLANSMLTSLGGADLSGYDPSAIWAVSMSYQDQLVFPPRVNPIPEPGTVGLYAFGALIAALGLKKKAAR
ncbi:MAG TPA: hypothetical protein VMR50_17155 [Myxococcota bacterium]|nr:hypothetical protein [Myxococcota bacterium]